MSQALQIASVPTLLAIGVVGCLAPRWIASRVPNPEKALQLGSAFSAGIFVGAGMLHLLPDAEEDAEASDLDRTYPISMLIVSAGFIVLLAIELVAAEMVDRPWKSKPKLAVHEEEEDVELMLGHTDADGSISLTHDVSVSSKTSHSHRLVCCLGLLLAAPLMRVPRRRPHG